MKKLALATFLLSACPFAYGQPLCDSRANLVSQLTSKHQESQSAYGLTNSGTQILEVFTSQNGTWTILLTNRDGISCAMATGNNWINAHKEIPDS